MSDKPRALMLASVASMIGQFNMDNIQLLLDLGYGVDVVANFEEPGPISIERAESLKERLEDMGVSVFHVGIPREINKVGAISSSYKKVKKLCSDQNYNIVHCHSPIGGVIARLAARDIRNKGCKVIYTAHGFHFYKGAPKVNWLFFYPIEKICSRFTDVLITINEEDRGIAEQRMNAKRVERIPGVGIDTTKFGSYSEEEISKIKNKIGVPDGMGFVVSVGELNDNKNHELVLRSIAELDDVFYAIAGKGELEGHLLNLAKELGVSDRVNILGYRTDIPLLVQSADVFAFPSLREGLGLSAIEALAAGTSVVGKRGRGISEYVIDGETGYLFENDVDSCKAAITKALANAHLLGSNCRRTAKRYDVAETRQIMKRIYKTVAEVGE